MTASKSAKRLVEVPGARDAVDEAAGRAARHWAGIDALDEAIVNRIARTARYLDRMLSQTAGDHGLNASEYRLLVALWKSGPVSPGELSRRLLVSSGVMTNRLDALERKGLVERQPHPSDRRGILVSLTDAGVAKLSVLIEEQAIKESAMLDALPQAQRRRLNDLLRDLMRCFDQDVPVGETGLSS